mmetsp:Transcript_82351/g.163396  ORF Transcript_82351/g.163396 Transcript_82351/m.163396 type:complete len:129 (-) Transcript_82351:83-469(-)
MWNLNLTKGRRADPQSGLLCQSKMAFASPLWPVRPLQRIAARPAAGQLRGKLAVPTSTGHLLSNHRHCRPNMFRGQPRQGCVKKHAARQRSGSRRSPVKCAADDRTLQVILQLLLQRTVPSAAAPEQL